ncbi:hypothetical protein Tco_0435956, partial [Tanacetum coccineum]
MSKEPHQQEYVRITKAMAVKNGYELDTNQELVNASLYTKETKRVDENFNKNLPDQNDINSGEEGLALCIEGYVSKSEIVGAKITPDMLEDENEKEEFVVDGEVDEGYFHIKPVYKKIVHM